MRIGFLVTLLCVLIVSHVWLVSQLGRYAPPEVIVEPEAFCLEKEKDSLKLQRIENIVNYTFRFDVDVLNLSGYRESEYPAWSAFDVSVDMNIPLRKNLKLSFNMYASQLNISTDCAFLSLTLADGANVISLGYYLGYQLPEWTFLKDYYVSYRVSDTLDMWVRGKRSIWDDLVRKNVSLTHSLNIAKATFGILSYNPTPRSSNNRKMQALFNVTENALFFETSAFVKITPSSYQFPVNVVFLMLMDIVFFVLTAKAFKVPRESKKDNSFHAARAQIS